ncbi:hypothetical protein HYV86_02325 [Candidatus Woesearchaeota archaeon]|nr:hypothetical protein [Candidatus Woesearchaeota archaeon]
MILIPLTSLIGIPLGALVGHIAKEELHDAEKYIRTVSSFLFYIMLVSLFLTLPFPSMVYQLGYGLLILTISTTEIVSKKPFYIPSITPLILFISLFFTPPQYLLINSSLFLLAGIPLGSQLYHDATQNSKKS